MSAADWGIPTPSQGMPVTPLATPFSSLAEGVAGALDTIDARYRPVSGVVSGPASGWTVEATQVWKIAGWVYILFIANKSVNVAANASENVCTVQDGFRPATGQYLVAGATFGSTAPAPGLVQLSSAGVITVFNSATAHNSFSAIFAHQANK